MNRKVTASGQATRVYTIDYRLSPFVEIGRASLRKLDHPTGAIMYNNSGQVQASGEASQGIVGSIPTNRSLTIEYAPVAEWYTL